MFHFLLNSLEIAINIIRENFNDSKPSMHLHPNILNKRASKKIYGSSIQHNTTYMTQLRDQFVKSIP
jgi:hypothetical protein